MYPLMLLTILLIALLVVEWWRRSLLVRIAALLVGLLQLTLAQSNSGVAVRAVIGLPREQRLRNFNSVRHDTVSDYASGVLTLDDRLGQDYWIDWKYRLIALGALAWLVVNPALQRPRLGGQSRPNEQAAPKPAA